MAIRKPEQMDFSGKNLIMIIQGTPGVGKTTLALSAPDVLLIDADNGMCRVRPEHRKDASLSTSYREVRADIAEAKASGRYRTVVIDTGGAFVDMLKQHVIDNPDEFKGGGKSSGGLAQAGYGYVKQLFLAFSAELRRDFNVVYLFHEQKGKDDDVTTYDIVCEGSAKTLVYQPADLAAHMFIQGGKRYLGFSPTESYYAKSAYGVKGIIEVPELRDGEKNDFLTKLFGQVRDNLKKDSEAMAPMQKMYDQIMAEAPDMMKCVTDADTANQCLQTISAMEHALTSKTELWNLLKARAAELNVKYNSRTKVFYYAGA